MEDNSSKMEESGSKKEESGSKLVYEAPNLTELYLGTTVVSGESKGQNDDPADNSQGGGWENVGGGTTDI